MGGFFGVVSTDDSVADLYYGTDYHSHLGTMRGGLAVSNGDGFSRIIHDITNAQFRSKFEDDLPRLSGPMGIGVISDYEDQPLIIRSHHGTYAIVMEWVNGLTFEELNARLDEKNTYFDPAQPFAWIGGTGTEMPLTLLEWRLYQRFKDRSILLRPRDDTDHFLGGDPGWTQEQFRAWASRFPQIGSLDPPDPKNRPQGFERTFASWMFNHPGFRCIGVEKVTMEIRPGEMHEFDVLFYLRLDEEGS